MGPRICGDTSLEARLYDSSRLSAWVSSVQVRTELRASDSPFSQSIENCTEGGFRLGKGMDHVKKPHVFVVWKFPPAAVPSAPRPCSFLSVWVLVLAKQSPRHAPSAESREDCGEDMEGGESDRESQQGSKQMGQASPKKTACSHHLRGLFQITSSWFPKHQQARSVSVGVAPRQRDLGPGKVPRVQISGWFQFCRTVGAGTFSS